MKNLFSVLALLFIISSPIFSEKIFLKDGTILVGTIIAQNEEKVTIKSNLGEIDIKKNSIEKINYEADTEKSSADDSKSKELVMNGYFGFRPLAIILSAMTGILNINFEGQTAFNENWVMNTATDIAYISQPSFAYAIAVGIGAQYNFFGNYLDGLYLSLQPGFISGYANNTTLFAWYIFPELGYQGVTDSDFTWGVYTGYSIASISSFSGFKLGVKIGVALSDPLAPIYKE